MWHLSLSAWCFVRILLVFSKILPRRIQPSTHFYATILLGIFQKSYTWFSLISHFYCQHYVITSPLSFYIHTTTFYVNGAIKTYTREFTNFHQQSWRFISMMRGYHQKARSQACGSYLALSNEEKRSLPRVSKWPKWATKDILVLFGAPFCSFHRPEN